MLNLLNLETPARGVQSLLPTMARLTFALTLFLFFWKAGLTKFDGPFTLSIGAYAQIFPKTFEAVGYDPNGLSLIHKLIAMAGSYGEIILPLMIVLGFLTRIASISMIIFIIVLSIVDHFGHNLATGSLIDADPHGKIADMRLYWIMNLLIIFALGAGRLSIDNLIGIRDKF